jgi:tRNA(Ile)-lysidine synthase
MQKRFSSYLDDNKLINNNKPVLLSVSGGLDSVVMTHLFRNSGLPFAIAHCNFHLRGRESDDDASFVKEISKNCEVEFHLAESNTENFAIEQKISIQMAARHLRFKWLERFVEKFDYQCYATAHHQDDQIETLMINFLRGCGISGLHGILPRKGNLIHPMLFTNRIEIAEYARINNLPFREDSSNLGNDYLRNKIRHKLIPVIKDIDSGFGNTFTENIKRFRQAEIIYRQQVQSVSSTLVQKEADQVRISIKLLLNLNPIESYLFEIISPYGYSYLDVKNILSSLKKQSGRKFFSKSHRLFKDREFLIIDKKSNQYSESNEYIIKQDSKELHEPIGLDFSNIIKNPQTKIKTDKSEALLDSVKLNYPMKIRKWQSGDYFYPLGMKGKKRISDFFIENKISIPDKEKIWLLVSDEQVVWIIGRRIDNRFKVTDETKNILRIKIR